MSGERLTSEKHADCIFLLDELAETSDEDEINELVWQALICAYLDHPLWRDVAEAVFAKHGYTPEEIRQHNDGLGVISEGDRG